MKRLLVFVILMIFGITGVAGATTIKDMCFPKIGKLQWTPPTFPHRIGPKAWEPKLLQLKPFVNMWGNGKFEELLDCKNKLRFIKSFHIGRRCGKPVPEPGTLLLLGTGLVAFAGIGRKKFFKRKSY